jgi:hypothetical protein
VQGGSVWRLRVVSEACQTVVVDGESVAVGKGELISLMVVFLTERQGWQMERQHLNPVLPFFRCTPLFAVPPTDPMNDEG